MQEVSGSIPLTSTTDFESGLVRVRSELLTEFQGFDPIV
jgi:hypothetical protein